MKIGMYGMGKLGLPVALAIESKGHEVMGYDIRPEPYEYIENKHYPFREEGVPELLENTQIRMTKDIGTLAISNDIVFMPIQTPHQSHLEGDRPLPSERADFDYTYLKKALQDFSKYDSTLAVISTCLPRTYENQLKPLKGNTEYVYTPQFIAMGTVVEDYLNPEFNLLGTDNEKVANKLEDFYATINDAPTLRTDITTAEGIKVAYNTFITMKTVLGNAWGEMSEKLGMNFDDIYKSWELSHKRLLSPKYLKAGMSDGGGCFPVGELVMTIEGMRPIETIRVGDLVLTHDGTFQRVLKLWERDYNGELIVAQVRGLPKVRMTVEHPVLVRKDGRTRVPDGRRNTYHKIIDKLHPVKELRADHLTLDSMIAWPKLTGSGDYAKPNKSFTYLAGWYLSEGSVESSSRRGRIRFDLHKREKQDALQIEEWLIDCSHSRTNNRGKTAKIVHKVEGNKRSVRFGNKGLASKLLNMFGKGSADKRIPVEFLWGDIADAEALLWGLIRGDGHRSQNGVSYSTISRDLAWGVFVILHRLELNPTLREIPPRGNHKRAYEVRVRNRRLASKLCEIVGWEPYEYDKDIQTYADDGKNVWRHIQKLKRESYEGKVYNLWVEKNHTYVVGCGAVHNCHPRDNIALSYIAEQVEISHNIWEDLMSAREDYEQWHADIAQQTAEEADLPLIILGRSFKPETNIETGSPAKLMANQLGEYPRTHLEDSAHDQVAVYFIATAHDRYKDYDFPKGSIVIDPFGYIEKKHGITVKRLGRK